MATTSNAKQTVVLKEGWLQKQGEHVKIWRPRWFVLRDDGTFIGFMSKPSPKHSQQPLNRWKIHSGVNITILSKDMIPDRESAFVISLLEWNTHINRTFCAESGSERKEWIEAIQKISHIEETTQTHEPSNAREETAAKEEPPDSKASRKLAKRMDDFEMLNVIGRGTFGKVVMCRDKSNGEILAMKILKKDVIVAKDEIAHTLSENRVLQSIKHPFLASFKYSFQTNDRLCLVMEYVNGGELFFHLSRERMFSEDCTRFYGGEITLAIQYLHELGILYRNIGLENLMLDSEGHVKLIGFGFSKLDIRYGATTKSFCGSPEYLAPEILEDNDYGRAVDWWALGVVMYEMMCGRLPFYSRDHKQLFEMILTEDVKFPSRLAEPAKLLLSALLQKDPAKRLGGGAGDAVEVKGHMFFQTINWTDLYDRKVEPPYKPKIKDATDVSNFDSKFTSENPQLTPPDPNDPKSGVGAGVYFDGFN